MLGVSKIITGEYAPGTTTIRLIDVESGDIEAASTIRNLVYKRGNWQQVPLLEIAKKLLIELFK